LFEFARLNELRDPIVPPRGSMSFTLADNLDVAESAMAAANALVILDTVILEHHILGPHQCPAATDIDAEVVQDALSAMEPREHSGETLAGTEADQIRKVLAATGGNKSRAAQILGIERKRFIASSSGCGWARNRRRCRTARASGVLAHSFRARTAPE
jgi:DNA-binding NtrC family response regulator